MGIWEILSQQLGLTMASIIFVYVMFEKFFSPHLRTYVKKPAHKFPDLMYPYIQITFHEFSGEGLKKSEAYTAIQTYLSATSSQKAKRLKAEVVKDSHTPLVLGLDDNEEITDEFDGVKLWWVSNHTTNKSQFEKRSLTLTFHNRYRDLITSSYIQHVLEQGKAITTKNRQLKLYTNIPSNDRYGYRRSMWSHIVFEHPARFETLAMDPKKKEEIVNDLVKFKEGKEYYAKIGKAWKRGYLLYGPPGTGKSTMIAAMANFMNYDLYDLELTAVKENTELRKLLFEISGKSIIVIEDIDCSLDLMGKRKKKKEKDDDKPKDPIKKAEEEKEENKDSKLTLSGLLNFIDGIWSACGGERIIIFTTNFVDKLDPALIRRGRMDKHIELSYCGYEAFKMLAKNYLDIDSHNLFPIIEKLLGETNMTPANVVENLMLKSNNVELDTCLQNLIKSLEEAKKKAEEEAKEKAEDENELDGSRQLAEVPDFPLTDVPNTTAHVKVETSSTEDLDDQRSSFETLKVSTISQLKLLSPKLHCLKIEGCESLEALPDDLFGRIPALQELYLISCSSLRSIPYAASLTTLYIRNCRSLELLPYLESRHKHPSLHHLFIGSSCDSLTTLPLDLFTELKILCIWDCLNLLSIYVAGEFKGPLASLESLEIRDCPRLKSFPDDGLYTPNLASIFLSNCKDLNQLPKSMNTLTSLKSLFLHRCPQIESFPFGGLPSSLTLLSIVYCDKLTPQEDWGLHNLESLIHFELEGGCMGMESFPQEKLLPRNINSLRISTLQSLKKLDYEGFKHLNALHTLEIHRCAILRSLPEQRLPSSLNYLCVQECPLLTRRLKPKTGKDWYKVAHIPHLQIDDQVLS